MKKYIRSFSALTFCVLCLISMVVPIFSMELAVTAAECPYPGGHALGPVEHNDWYHYKVYTRIALSYCYSYYNARCTQDCVYCDYRVYVDCSHPSSSTRVSHTWIKEPEPDYDHYVCSNDGCHTTRPLD